ncbi:MAG: Fe(2+)-trafficking protein [Phycisphaerales bacterium]|jgi:Fe-S cluster biosynthesis and repair protein YggX|nr:Fe(2+)-trafficking protein [Phycisphaerales bacterium]
MNTPTPEQSPSQDAALTDRIAQFENMAVADPSNEMAHFSLGSSYLKANRAAEAAKALAKCIELNPDMSKAYELCGQALVAAGDRDKAEEVLSRGYLIAAGRGDRMPQEAMAALLGTIGRPVPDIDAATAEKARTLEASGSFVCRCSGSPGTQLADPPFKGPVGAWIAEHISEETWDVWIHQGTKVINELRLDLSRPEDSAMYDQHMYDFLDVPEDVR